MTIFAFDPEGATATFEHMAGELAGGVRPNDASFGLIGIQLEEGAGETGNVLDSDAEVGWNAWLSRTLEGKAAARFADRIGGHLWIWAVIPAGTDSATRDVDNLGRRICTRLLQDKEAAYGAASSIRPSSDRHSVGYGTAVIIRSGDGSLKDALYEAFVAVAAQIRGSARPGLDNLQSGEMERILREGDIRSVYQPLFHLRRETLFGYEALTRCPPGSSFDGPLALFGYAEKEGYAFALDRLARETAIRSCPYLNPKQKIFININSGIMKDPHFVSGQTRNWLSAKGLNPGQVVLELTERSSIDDFEEAKRMLAHYRNQGYQIAIDDAGAGYSSLQAIVELRPDYIKLDRSLVRHADRDEMKMQMLGTFVRFARRMRIQTVAEGIETPEELHLVRKLGIDFGQGYLIGRPSEHPVLSLASGVPKRR